MDEDNWPMAFPESGYVYSKEVSIHAHLLYSNGNLLRQALEEMAAKNDGKVTCPRSGETCHIPDLRKVFIS